MPLIIYLHGSSRRGRDVEEVKANGLAALMDELDDFEFVVASPQALSKYAWQRCWRPDDLTLLLDHLLATFHIDPKRVLPPSHQCIGGYGIRRDPICDPKRYCGGHPPHTFPREVRFKRNRDHPL